MAHTTPMSALPGQTPLRKLLVPTDFSARADKALRYALDVARPARAEIHLLHVIPPIEGDAISPLRYAPEAIAAHETPDKVIYNLLASTIARIGAGDVRIEPVTQRALRTARGIRRYAEREAIDLIVMTTHGGHGARKPHLPGSTVVEVVHHAPCSTLTLHEHQPETALSDVRRVLVPVDFSVASIPLLRQAQQLAAHLNAEIDLLHVIESPSFLAPLAGVATLYDLVPNLREHATARMQHLLDRASDTDVPITTHLRDGRPAATIIDFAEERGTDLLIIATRGLSGVTHFLLGSTTERVVYAAPCPVLTVQPPPGNAEPNDEPAEAEHAG